MDLSHRLDICPKSRVGGCTTFLPGLEVPAGTGPQKLLLDAQPNRHFFTWLESYPKRFGGPAMFELRGGFGNFASPDNPFFNGKVAMIMQGVWMNNFIKKYAPAGF